MKANLWLLHFLLIVLFMKERFNDSFAINEGSSQTL